MTLKTLTLLFISPLNLIFTDADGQGERVMLKIVKRKINLKTLINPDYNRYQESITVSLNA